MTANISYKGTDIDSIYEARIGTARIGIGYQVAGVNISDRYTDLAAVTIANGNIATRIPPTGNLFSSSVDLSSLFAGNPSQYSLSTLTTQTGSSVKNVGAMQTLTHQFTVSFPSAAALTNYFTYGGRIQISAVNSGSFLGGSADATLQAMFASMGTLVIYDVGVYKTGAGGTIIVNNGGTTIGAGFAQLYSLTDGSPYSTSNYSVSMSGTGQNAGSVSVLTFVCTLTLVQAGVTADTYSGSRISQVQQRNYAGAVTPTQATPTYATSIFNW